MGFGKCHLLFGCGIMKFFIISLFLLLLFDSPQGSTLSRRRPGKGLNTTLQTNFNGTYERTNPCNNEQVETSHYTATHEYHHHSKENNWNDYSNKCAAIIGSFIQAIGKLIHLNSTESGKFNFHINTTISQRQIGHCAENKSCIPPTIIIEATDCKIPPNSSKDLENGCKKSPCKIVEPCKTFKMQKYSLTGVPSSRDNKTGEEICPWEKDNEKIIITSCEEETPLKSHEQEQEHESCPTECHETTSTSSQESLTKYPTQPADQSSEEEKTSTGVENLTTPHDFPSRGPQNVPSHFPFTEISASTPAVFDDGLTTDSYAIITTRTRPEDEFTTTYSPNEHEPSSTNSFNTDPTQPETPEEFSPISTPLTPPASYPSTKTGFANGKYSHYRHTTTTKKPKGDNSSNNIPESTPCEGQSTLPNSSCSYQTPEPSTSEFPTTKFTDQPTSSTSLDTESPHSTVTLYSHSPPFTSPGLEPTDSPLTTVPTLDSEHITTEFHDTRTLEWQSSPDYSTTHDDTKASSPSDFTDEPTPTSPSYAESPSSTVPPVDQFSSTPYSLSVTDNNDTTKSPLISVTPNDNENIMTKLHSTITPEWPSSPDYSSPYSYDVTTASPSDFSPQPVPSTHESESQLPTDDYETTEIRPPLWSTTEEETPVTQFSTTLPPETKTPFDHENDATTELPSSEYSDEANPSTLTFKESPLSTITPFDQISSASSSKFPPDNYDTSEFPDTSVSSYKNENITTELHSTGTPDWQSSADYTNSYKNDETESTTSQFSDPTSPDVTSPFSSITTFSPLPSSSTPEQDSADIYETTEPQSYSTTASEDETTTTNIPTTLPSEVQTPTENNDTTTGVTNSVLYDHQTPSGTMQSESLVTEKTHSDQYPSIISTQQPRGNYETSVPELSTLDTSEEETTPTVSSYPPRTPRTTQSPASDFYDEPTSGTFADTETQFSSSTTIDQFSSTRSTEEKLIENNDTSTPSPSSGPTYPYETTTDKIQTTDRSDSPSSLEYDNETTTESPASDYSDEQSPSSPSDIESPFPTVTPLSSTASSQTPTEDYDITGSPPTSVSPHDNENIKAELYSTGTPEWQTSTDYSRPHINDETGSTPYDFSDETTPGTLSTTESPFSSVTTPFDQFSTPFSQSPTDNETLEIPPTSLTPEDNENITTEFSTTGTPEWLSSSPDYSSPYSHDFTTPSDYSEKPTPRTFPENESSFSTVTPFDHFSTPYSQSTTDNNDTTQSPLTSVTPNDNENITTESATIRTPGWQSTSPDYSSSYSHDVKTASVPSDFSDEPTTRSPTDTESPFSTITPLGELSSSTSPQQETTETFETNEPQGSTQHPSKEETHLTQIPTTVFPESETPLYYENDTTTEIPSSDHSEEPTPYTESPSSTVTPFDQFSSTPYSQYTTDNYDTTESALTTVTPDDRENITAELHSTGTPEWRSSPDYTSPYINEETEFSEGPTSSTPESESPLTTKSPIDQFTSITFSQPSTDSYETAETQLPSETPLEDENMTTNIHTKLPSESQTPLEFNDTTTGVTDSLLYDHQIPTGTMQPESLVTGETPSDQPSSEKHPMGHDITQSPLTSVSPNENENIRTELHSTGTPEWQSTSPDYSSSYSHDVTTASIPSDFSDEPTTSRATDTESPFSTISPLGELSSSTSPQQETTETFETNETQPFSTTSLKDETYVTQFPITMPPESETPFNQENNTTTELPPSDKSEELTPSTLAETEPSSSTATPFDQFSSSPFSQSPSDNYETSESFLTSVTPDGKENITTEYHTTGTPEWQSSPDYSSPYTMDDTGESPTSGFSYEGTPSAISETVSQTTASDSFSVHESSSSTEYTTLTSGYTGKDSPSYPDVPSNLPSDTETPSTPTTQSSTDIYTSDSPSTANPTGDDYQDSFYYTTGNPSPSTTYPMNHHTVSENEPSATYQPSFALEGQTTASESLYVGPETTAFPSETEPTASPSSTKYQSTVVPSVTPEDLYYSTQMSTSAPRDDSVTYTPVGEQSPEAPLNETKPSAKSFVTDQPTSAQTISESSTTPTDGYASYGQTHTNPELESESLISTVGNDQSPPGKFQPSHVPESRTETTLPYSNEPSVDSEPSSTERAPVDDPLKTTPWLISTAETIAQNDVSQPEYTSTPYDSSPTGIDYSQPAESPFSTTHTFETEPDEQPLTTPDASHSPQPTNNAHDHLSSTTSPQFTTSSYDEDTAISTDYPFASTQPPEDDSSELPSSVNRYSTTSQSSYPTEPQYSTSTIRQSEDYPTPSGIPFTADESISPSVPPASSTYVDRMTSSSEGMPTYPQSPASDPQPRPSADYTTEIPDYQTVGNPSQTFDYTSSDEFTTFGPNASTTESEHQTTYPYTGTETDFDENLTVPTILNQSELSSQSDSVTVTPTPDTGVSTDDISPHEVTTPRTTLETHRTEETSERFSPHPTTAVNYDEEVTTEYKTSLAPQSQPQETMKPVDPHSDDNIPNSSPDQPVTVSPFEFEPTSEFTYDRSTSETSGSEISTQTTFSETSPEIQYTTSPTEQTSHSEMTTNEYSLTHTSQPQPYFSSQQPVSSPSPPFYTDESQPTESPIPTDQSPKPTQTTPAFYSPFHSTVSPQGSSDYLDDETAPVSDAPTEGKTTEEHLQESTPYSDPFSKYNVRKRPEGESLFGPKTSPMYIENTSEEYSNDHSSTLRSDYTSETTSTLDTDNTVPTDRKTFDGPTEEQPTTPEEGTTHPPTMSSTNPPPTEPSDSLYQTTESNTFSPFHVTTPQPDFSEDPSNTSPIPDETSSFEQTQNAISTTPPYFGETNSNFIPYQSTQPNAGMSTTQDVTITTQSDSHTLVSDLTTPSDESGEDCISRCKQHGMPVAPLLCPFDPVLKGNMTAPSYYILISKLPVGDNDDERFQVEKVYLGDGTPLNCTDNIRKTFPTSWYTSVPIKSAGTVRLRPKCDSA